jgi:serine/threonine-protein kinase
MASADDDDLPRMLGGGRYRLEASIGHGGMGVVYRGMDLTMHRAIAVKLIRSVDGNEIDDEVAGRFLREAKHTARLQHEHIIDVFDLGRDPTGMYFVMELLTGESLSARIRREGKLAPERTVHIGSQICDALEVAHRSSVIHRDLKPANIMLISRAGDDDFVKVLDFGVAKSVAGDDQTQLTHTGMLVGTVDYMAPEQIMGKPVDGRTDVYSLGVMLYKMLSGKNPFRDGGVPALIHAHLNTMPKPLIEVGQGIPNELDHVVLRCLMKNPDRRFESMAELSRALRSAVHGSEPQGRMLDLEYRSGSDSYDDATAMSGPRGYDEEVPAEDATISDDPTIQFDRKMPLRRLTAEELGVTPSSPSRLHAHEGSQPLPLPPRPRQIIPMQSGSGPALGPPVNYPEELSTQKRGVPNEVRNLQRERKQTGEDGKICAMCQTKNPAHATGCVACGVSLGTSEQESLRVRNRTGPPPRIPSTTGPHTPPPVPRGSGSSNTGPPPFKSRFESNYANVPPPPVPPPAPSSRKNMGPQVPPPAPTPRDGVRATRPTGPPPPGSMPPPSMPPPSMPPPWYPGQPLPAAPAQPTTTWEKFLRWTGLKSR